MKKQAATSAEREPAAKRRRKNRSRPTPKWIADSNNIDVIAQRRCLMILRVLSGEQPVTEAIAEAKITRPLYYLLERRALEAMIRSLTPGAESSPGAITTPGGIHELEGRVKKLEQEKRRVERLLFLARKVIGTGPMKMSRRGKPSKVSSAQKSIPSGKKASSTRTQSEMSSSSTNSIPTKTGEGERSSGKGN